MYHPYSEFSDIVAHLEFVREEPSKGLFLGKVLHHDFGPLALDIFTSASARDAWCAEMFVYFVALDEMRNIGSAAQSVVRRNLKAWSAPKAASKKKTRGKQ